MSLQAPFHEERLSTGPVLNGSAYVTHFTGPSSKGMELRNKAFVSLDTRLMKLCLFLERNDHSQFFTVG